MRETTRFAGCSSRTVSRASSMTTIDPSPYPPGTHPVARAVRSARNSGARYRMTTIAHLPEAGRWADGGATEVAPTLATVPSPEGSWWHASGGLLASGPSSAFPVLDEGQWRIWTKVSYPLQWRGRAGVSPASELSTCVLPRAVARNGVRGTWYVVRGTWYVVRGTWYVGSEARVHSPAWQPRGAGAPPRAPRRG